MLYKSKFLFSNLIVLLIVCSCSTSEEFVRPNTDFKKYDRLAVLPLVDYPNQPSSGTVVADIISMELIKEGIDVVDRANTVQILNEQKLGLSGVIDETTAPKVGKLLGVNAIISGSVNEYGTTTTNIQVVQGADPAYMPISSAGVSLKLIDVETGQMVWAASARGTEVGNNLMANAARKAVRDAMEKLVKHLR